MGAKVEFLRDIRLTGTYKKNYTLEPPSNTFSKDKLFKLAHIQKQEDRPYNCDNCQYKCKKKGATNIHKRMHTEINHSSAKFVQMSPLVSMFLQYHILFHHSYIQYTT